MNGIREIRFRATSRLLAEFYGTPWSILSGKLAEIEAVLNARSITLASDQEIAAARRDGSPMRSFGSIAVIPVFGTIAPRANMMTEMSGGTSAEVLARTIRAAASDPKIGAIVLDVDSPGGATPGIQDAAAAVREARAEKPVVAVANSLMASAAYWIASGAGEIVAIPGADVGSIGVFAIHRDYSVADAQDGVRTTIISAGKLKTAGNPYEPLGDEARASIRARVDEAYAAFVRDVAIGRGKKESDVTDGMGQGALLGSEAARAAGLVDRVETMDQVLARYTGPPRRGSNPKAVAALRAARVLQV